MNDKFFCRICSKEVKLFQTYNYFYHCCGKCLLIAKKVRERIGKKYYWVKKGGKEIQEAVKKIREEKEDKKGRIR